MATVSVPGVSAEQVIKLCKSQGWEAHESRQFMPDDALLRGLLLLFGFLMLVVIAYVVADAIWGVSEVLFSAVAGFGTQGSTIQQGANAYRDTRLTYAQQNYAPPSAPAAP